MTFNRLTDWLLLAAYAVAAFAAAYPLLAQSF
jgi:hypothetical protein